MSDILKTVLGGALAVTTTGAIPEAYAQQPAPMVRPAEPAVAPKEVKVFPVDAKKEPLAAAMKEKNYMRAKILTGLEQMDPDAKYPIVEFDKAGKPLEKKGEVSGKDLRAAVTLLEAFGVKRTMDDATFELFNEELYGNKKGPGDDAKIQEAGKQKLIKALTIVSGRTAAKLPPTPMAPAAPPMPGGGKSSKSPVSFEQFVARETYLDELVASTEKQIAMDFPSKTTDFAERGTVSTGRA